MIVSIMYKNIVTPYLKEKKVAYLVVISECCTVMNVFDDHDIVQVIF